MTALKLTYKTNILSQERRREIRQALQKMPHAQWTEKTEQHCEYRLDLQCQDPKGWARIKQFANGTFYLEASSEELLRTILMPLQLEGQLKILEPPKTHATKAPESSNLNLAGAYIGTDESGKGDYFGPLVVSGVFVSDETKPLLTELGVVDSKQLSDKVIMNMAQKIKTCVGPQGFSIIEMGPEKYNDLYERFKRQGKNLNHLLAWGHARAIENLLLSHPDCVQAIADQFGHERYIQSQLQEKGQQITLHQTHRAEANIGVAAASILARERFVSKINHLSQEFDMKLPVGAGGHVTEIAKRFIKTHGRPSLEKVAKLHFKTTQALPG